LRFHIEIINVVKLINVDVGLGIEDIEVFNFNILKFAGISI